MTHTRRQVTTRAAPPGGHSALNTAGRAVPTPLSLPSRAASEPSERAGRAASEPLGGRHHSNRAPRRRRARWEL